jgi:prepilin-type N-terminal cleavage/methylation domain-containing protein
MTTRRRTSNPRRAFTLIEVLIAVLVLALGLLGIGAVFPVAVRAQRISSDDVLGTAAVNSARAYLNTYNFHSAMVPWTNGAEPDTRNFWRDWRDARPTPDGGLNSITPAGGPPSAFDQGYWLVPDVTDDNNRLIMGVPANPGQGRAFSSQVVIPVRERLYPLGAAGDPPPQFVWDLAVHRVSDFDHRTDSTVDDLEVVIFVRRIDPRIRPAANHTLYQVLTGERNGGVNNANRRRPVGVVATGPQAELPSGDGTGNYALPLTADVDFLFNPPANPYRDRLYLTPAVTQKNWEMLRQPGQKLVDNLGQIHTVRTWDDEGAQRYVILESPVKTFSSSSGLIKQVVFTPQVPASVFVTRVKP